MKNKIKILIAEHDAVDLELLNNELKTGGIHYESAVVHTKSGYIDALKSFIPDIILADYTFPSFDGPAAFAIREEIAPDTPFIFVSGTIGEEKSIELIRNGVTDYVLKDKLFTLNHKLIRALKEAKEKQDKKQTEQKLLLSERLLVRAQHVARMGNWEFDFASNTIHCSAETCIIYGLMPDQNVLSNEEGLEFIHPEDVAFVIEKLKECVELLLDLSLRYRIVHKGGSIRYVYSEGKLEFDSNGRPAGLYGIVQDVTEKVVLENKLMNERFTKQSEITAAVLAAQETERAEIGKELHENIKPILGAIKLYIDLAKNDEVNRQLFLEKSSCYILDVIEETRKISRALVSPGKQWGLFNSIKILVDDFAMVHPLKIQFKEDNIEEEYLDEKLQLTIFRIIQEQLSNVLKHAKATKIIINLSRHDDEVVLVISDNGKGGDPLKEIAGVGIKNIKSRADLYNGKVTIVSKPGKGYELRVALSLNYYMNKPKLFNVMPAL